MKLARTGFARVLSITAIFCLLFQQLGFAQTAGQINFSSFFNKPAAMPAVDVVRLPHLRYLAYDDAANTFRLLLEKGYAHNGIKPDINSESKDVFKYFLTGISLPNDTFWVNLRPDSELKIIDNRLAKTDVGLIMLEADLQLKKDTASFTSPETPQGKAYWDRLYKKAEEIYGSDSLDIPTLTRPWIVPGEVIVHYTKDSAYVYKATLKVMLEQDYLKSSAQYNFNDPRAKELNEYSSQLIRELIIPGLTKEINTSERYAKLRQVYYSLILAQWFKGQFNKGKGAYAGRIDRGDLKGLVSGQSWSPKTYFDAYQKSFKDGEYNLQIPAYSLSGKTIRTYFSGGANLDLSASQAIELQPGQGILTKYVIQAVTNNGAVMPVIVDRQGNLFQGQISDEPYLHQIEEAVSSPVNNITVSVNNKELQAPLKENSLSKFLESLGYIPEVMFTQVKGEGPRVLINGKPALSETEIKATDKIAINYISPLYYLPLVNHQFSKDNWPQSLAEIEALHRSHNLQQFTTNLIIFEQAMKRGDFDGQISELVAQGITDPQQIYDIVTLASYKGRVDYFAGLNPKGNGSYEVPPQFMHNVEKTAEYQRKIIAQNPKNVLVKTPLTAAGLQAIRDNALNEHMLRNNVTLLFGPKQWLSLYKTELYVLEERVKAGMPIADYFGNDSDFIRRKLDLLMLIITALEKDPSVDREDLEELKQLAVLYPVGLGKTLDRWNNYVYGQRSLPEGTLWVPELDELKSQFAKTMELAERKGLGRLSADNLRISFWSSTGLKGDAVKLGIDPLVYFVNLVGPRNGNTMPDPNLLITAIEKAYKDLTNREKGQAILALADNTYDDKIITKYDPRGNHKYADEKFTPTYIVNKTNELLKKYSEQILSIKGTHHRIKDIDIKTEIRNYCQDLKKLAKNGELSQELYNQEMIDVDDPGFKFNIDAMASLLTWRGGDLFQVAYDGSLAATKQKIGEFASSPLTVKRALAALESSQSPLAKKMLPKIKDGTLNKDKLLEELERLTYIDLPNDVKGLVKLFIERPTSYGLALEEIANSSTEEFSLNSQALAWVAFIVTSSPDEKSSSPVKTGGIDFRYINLVTQAQMKELIGNFKLPALSVLKDVDLRSEASQIKRMLAAGITPSSQRVIKYVAACYVKNEDPAQIQEAAACLADLFRFQEDNLIETDAGLKAFLIVMDAKK